MKKQSISGHLEFKTSYYTDTKSFFRFFILTDFYGDTLYPHFVSNCIENNLQVEVLTRFTTFSKSQSKRELQKIIEDLEKSYYGTYSDKVTDEISNDTLDKMKEETINAKELVDQNRLYSSLFVVRLATSDFESLENQSRQIYELAEDNGFIVSVALNRQKEALDCFNNQYSKSLFSFKKYLFQENLATLAPIRNETKEVNQSTFWLGKTLPDNQFLGVSLLQSSNDNSHFLVTGTTRYGKSTLLKLIIIQALIKDYDVIYIDPQGEGQALAQATKADLKKVALNTGFKLLSKPETAEDMEIYTDLLASSFVELSKEETFRSYYTASLYELFKLDTVDLETYKQIIVAKDKEAGLNGRLVDSLVRLFDGKLGQMLSGLQDINISNQFTIFDFVDLQANDHNDKLKPLFLSLFTYAISKAMHKRHRKTLFIIDEAYQVLNDPASRNFIEKMIRKIGKMNGLVGVIDQSLSGYDPAFTGRLMSLCGNKILFRSTDNAYLATILDLEDINNLKDLGKGQFLLVNDSGKRYGQSIITQRLAKYITFESKANV